MIEKLNLRLWRSAAALAQIARNRARVVRHKLEIMKAVRDGNYEMNDKGVLIKRELQLGGWFHFSTPDGSMSFEPAHNLWTDQGLTAALAVFLGATAKPSAFYLSMSSGAVNPASNWTAANYAANATENTSTTEGYSEATRPAWTPGTAAANAIDNTASLARFTIACSTTINVNGFALQTVNTRGGTTGILINAVRTASQLVLPNGLLFDADYELTLADT